MSPLDARLENWGDCWRSRLRLDQAASIEGGYRSPQRQHWDSDLWVGFAPVSLPPLDHADAAEIESAVCATDIFSHALLKAFFVRKRKPRECIFVAVLAAGLRKFNLNEEEADALLAFHLAKAKDRVKEQLLVPAVIRKERAQAIVRNTLRLYPLTPLAIVPTMLPTI